MPLYAYRCTQCGHRFEKIQNFSDEEDLECPECHGLLERPLTAPSLSFKGAGWYVNDYAPKSAASESASDAASDSAKKPAAAEPKTPSAPSEAAPSKPASTPASSSAPASGTAGSNP